MTDEVMTGLNQAGDARFARDLMAETVIDPRDLPPVMLGPDSTARIDEHLARVACPACGSPKPTRAEHHDRIITRTLAAEANADSPIARENADHLRGVLRKHTDTLTNVADDLRIEGPFPDSAERDLLVAAARSVLRYAGEKP
jgi:hypothetical protein